ncbi:MAG: cysteine desulfurase family protein [Chitinophagaceae bacterium]
MAQRIYFDNAATTPIDPLVVDVMVPFLSTHFGNPSSIYSYGRENRLAIEKARKSVANILKAQPSEIFFTSGGTESSNTAIFNAVRELGCKRIITSRIEHHATLHSVEFLHKNSEASLEFVNILSNGHIDLEDLEKKLKESSVKTLVTLMHANNEIGNITDIKAVGEICKQNGAIFHADTVQTVGHFPIDLSNTYVDFITGAGHKFHGPKGIGLMYINQRNKISPFIHGGGQERNMRAGTENIYGIIGFAKALELANENHKVDSVYILSLKQYLKNRLTETVPGVIFNGDPDGNSLYTVLSVGFPHSEKSEMLLFNLDINHICVSGGSACSSGANQGSHVINALKTQPQSTVRFSFSKYNTKEEIDQVVETIKTLI